MTELSQADWKEVYDKMFVAFPGLYAWLVDACPSDENGKSNVKGTLDTWRLTVRECSKEELLRVVDSWIDGTRNPPLAYQRELTALTLKSCVMFDRSRLAAAQSQQNAPRRRRRERLAKESQHDIAPLLGAFLTKVDGGRNAESAKAEIEAMVSKLPIAQDLRPRYRCFACRDSGVRIVWHPEDMDEIKNGTLQRGDAVHEASVACHTCEKGELAARPCSNGKKRMATFDPNQHCLKSEDPFTFRSKTLAQEWVG